MFAAAIGAVDPLKIVPGRLPAPPKGRTIVVGAGKAAAAMAKAVEDHWQGPLQGLVITRYDHGMPTRAIEVVEAAHPVPDASGQQAARRILDQVKDLTPDDLVLCLISGGASALMAVPGGALTLADKQAVNKGLLKSGANIAEMNCVRKHLSGIKGGRLAAAAYPAQVVTLLISDVPGDDPSVIGSGPTVPDPTSAADAAAILKKYKMQVPDAVIAHLQSAAAETPKPNDPRLAALKTVMLGTPQAALDAAARIAGDAGYRPVILGDLEGEARDVALVHAGIARQIARHGQPAARPVAIISGGETTVTVRG
ncbi:MAG TPA: DUF4147 domain-containing protein, partial [Dongiaceae bacterium]|nr:DUF4147 domain-containing protein [Dongiaceae bacterium]